jgi:pimeloyl-ACP methyl ester carboxylesterase
VGEVGGQKYSAPVFTASKVSAQNETEYLTILLLPPGGNSKFQVRTKILGTKAEKFDVYVKYGFLSSDILTKEIEKSLTYYNGPDHLVVIPLPGSFGASGSPDQIDREAGPEIVNKQIDDLKRQRNARYINLAGFSLSGATALKLIGLRSDLRCVVLYAAPADREVKALKQYGIRSSYYGVSNPIRPIDYLVRRAPGSEIILVTQDPRDRVVDKSNSQQIYSKLQDRGFNAQIRMVNFDVPLAYPNIDLATYSFHEGGIPQSLSRMGECIRNDPRQNKPIDVQ